MKFAAVASVLCTVLCFGLVAAGADWPQWRGPNRDGKSAETGLLKRWPAEGPKLLWTADVNLGKGYSSMAVTKDAIYTTGLVGREGYVFAIDSSGKLKWKLSYGPEWTGDPPSARTTPTVDGDRIYIMTGLGRIICIDTKTQKEKWSIDTFQKFGGRNIAWGIAESPLVYGDTVVCTPGGNDAALVALDKMTGKTLWTTRGLSDRAGYCSPLLIQRGEKKLIVTVTANNIVGIGADDGQVLWKAPHRNQCAAHPVTPLYQDGQIYVTSGYNMGGVALRLAPDGAGVEQAWADKTLDVHHGGVVLVGGYIYGASWMGNNNGNWICLDWKSGQVKYDTQWKGKGCIVAADGMLYCYNERGDVALVEATPAGFKPVSSFPVTAGGGEHWAHPAIADGRLYIRHGGALLAYDIRGASWKAQAAEAPRPRQAPAAEKPPAAEKDANEAKAQAKLTIAMTYLRARMKDNAAETLQSIVDTYPGTKAAEQAKAELEKLK